MKKCVIPALSLALTTLLGCAGTPDKPEWINGNSGKYPPSRYLIGRGQSDTQAVARDRARADLAKTFQVGLLEESEDRVARTSESDGEVVLGHINTETSRHIVTRTEQAIEGIHIGDVWQNPDTGTHHALAVLNRLKVSSTLRATIALLDASTRSSVEQARASDDLLIKIGAARRALATQLERDRYQGYLRIVDVSGTGVRATYDTAGLRADLETLLGRVRLVPAVSADPLGGLERALSGALAHAGFLQASSAHAQYLVDANLQIVEHADEQGWHWVRGTLEVALQEPAANRVRGSHRWNIKTSAQHAKMARKRAADQVDKLLQNELGDVIVGFATPDG